VSGDTSLVWHDLDAHRFVDEGEPVEDAHGRAPFRVVINDAGAAGETADITAG